DSFGEALQLVGTTVETPRVAPGGSVDLVLGWQVLAASVPKLNWQITAESGNFHQIVLTGGPEGGRLSTTDWRKDDVLLDRERVVIPANAPPGPLHLMLSVVSPGDPALVAESASPVDLGTTDVLDVRHLTTPPTSIQHPVDWQVGDFAELVGYALSASSIHPGGHVTLT